MVADRREWHDLKPPHEGELAEHMDWIERSYDEALDPGRCFLCAHIVDRREQPASREDQAP